MICLLPALLPATTNPFIASIVQDDEDDEDDEDEDAIIPGRDMSVCNDDFDSKSDAPSSIMELSLAPDEGDEEDTAPMEAGGQKEKHSRKVLPLPSFSSCC